MKILSLRLEEFRKFDRPISVDGFDAGLNLISGPNETGKSTLLLALRAALFERHGSKTQAVKDFSPHHVKGARPTISLTFELGSERYLLEKSFLKRPSATLETKAGKRFQGADAEAELKRLLGLNPTEKMSADKNSPAHFGVLLTPQAQSFQQPNLADGTRHSLEAAIAEDIADLGNQSEVDGLLAEFRAEQALLVNGHGKKTGRYKDVAERLLDVESGIVDATAERDALRDQLAELERAISARSELQAAYQGVKLAERLATLETARAEAVHRQTLENRRLAAGQRLQAAEAQRAARQTRAEERERVAKEIETIEQTNDEKRERLVMIEQTLAQRAETHADLDERLRALSLRRRELESLGRHIERSGEIEARLAALATDVRLDLEADALDRVTLDGEPTAEQSALRQVTEGLSIEIEGIGRIGIEPKIEPMREALAAKTETDEAIGRHLAALDLDSTEREAIEDAWHAVASEIESLETSRKELDTTLVDERRQATEVKVTLDASNDRRADLSQRLFDIDKTDDDSQATPSDLDAEISDAKTAFDAADSAFRAAARSQEPAAPPTDEEIAALRTRIETERRALEEAGKKVLALEAAIAVRAGLGLDEKIDQLERQRHLLTEERDAFALEHQALSLLQSTLRDAADEAKATFNAPLSARLAPYIQELFPGATPIVTPDFSIRALDRKGQEEPFSQLSDGTREQIAILARLAFADMLQAEGLPALIVLDDALTFSDEVRLGRMAAILQKAATRMQVIILTCREDRFADIEATRLHIEPAGEATSSAA